MTSVNVTTTKNTVTVSEGDTRVVTIKTQGPQGPSLPDGDKGDVTVSSNGTAISINNNAVTSAKIADGAIVNADINASAAIALSKLATGALPTAITVTSANISDLSIVDADISGSAAISLSKLATGALPTAITVTSANISDLSIVNADINASAAIAGTKISPDFGSQNIVTTGTGATGALGVTGDITVSGTVDGVDIATRDALFGGLTSSSGVLSNGVTATTQSASDNSTKVATTAYTDTAISNLINGAPAALDTLNELAAALNDDAAFSTTVTNSIATKMPLAGGQFTGNITFSGTQTVDGRDLSVDGSKLDGIETGATADQTAAEIRTLVESASDSNVFTNADHSKLNGIEASATADQTASEIKTLLDSNGIVNSNVDASAAIAGTKISPNFGSQNVSSTGYFSFGTAGGTDNFSKSNLRIENTYPTLFFHDTDTNNDFYIRNADGVFNIHDVQANVNRFTLNSSGTAAFSGNLDVGAGVDVTGNITVTGTVDGRDVAADGTKLDGIESGATADQTASEIKTAYESNSDTNAFTDADHSKLDGIESGATADQTKSDIDALGIAASTATTLATSRNIGGVSFNGSANIDLPGVNTAGNQNTSGNAATATTLQTARTIAGTSFDGSANIDISYTNLTNKLSVGDGGLTQNNFTDALKTKLDGVETAATADQTAAEIKTLLDSNGIVNSNVDASAAIAGTKIDPNFGSQNINLTGQITIGGTLPTLNFVDSDNNSDFMIKNQNGKLEFRDTTNGSSRVIISSDGTIDFYGNVDCNSGLDVTGNITVTGTVDGVDIATRDTLFGGLTSSSGVLTNGVTATTQSASDNSTKVATTAYTDTAVANLVDSAPGTLNTLNELAAALGDDPNFATTVTNSIATKLPLAGGTLTGDLTISNTAPSIFLTDTNHDSDFRVMNQNGVFKIFDQTNGADRLEIFSGGQVVIDGNLDVGSGLDVTGNITVTGTVDGRDIATDGTKLDGIESNATADQTASEIVALVADQTIAPSTIDMEDNEKIKLGTGDDLQIFYDTTNSNIYNQTNSLYIRSADVRITNAGVSEHMAKFFSDGGVELFYDNSKKFHTRSNGVEVTGNTFIRADSSTDGILLIYADNGDDHDDLWRLKATDSGSNFHIDNYASSSWETTIKAVGNAQTELYYDNSKKFETTSTGIKINTDQIIHIAGSSTDINITSNQLKFNRDGNKSYIDQYGTGDIAIRTTPSGSQVERLVITSGGNIQIPNDNAKLEIGAGQDLNLSHDGTDSIITHDTGSGLFRLNVAAGGEVRITKSGPESMARFIPDGAVELYYDNSKKFETRGNGAQILGIGYIRADQNSDGRLALYADNGDDNDDLWRINATASGSNFAIDNYASGSWETNFKATGNGAAELYYDNSKKLETTSAGVTVTGGANFSSNVVVDNGTVRCNSGFSSDTDLIFNSDANANGSSAIIFQDGGSEKARITGGNIRIPNDSGKLQLGASQDLEAYHDGTNSYIVNKTGDLFITSTGSADDIHIISLDDISLKPQAGETGIYINGNGSVDLYYDNSKKLETISSGVQVSGTLFIPDGGSSSNRISIGNSGDLQIYHDGSNSYILNSTGNLILKDLTDAVYIQAPSIIFNDETTNENIARFISDGAAELYYDNSKKFETTANGVNIESGTPNFQVLASTDGENALLTLIGKTGSGGIGQVAIARIEAESKQSSNGASAMHLKTRKTNNTVTTAITIDENQDINFPIDGQRLKLGASADLQIYHDGSNSYIDDTATGNLVIRSNQINFDKYTGEALARFRADGNCELFHNNVSKFETTSAGVSVTGNITVSGTVDGVDVAALSASVSGFLSNIVEDTSPQLGGTLDANGQVISFPDSNGSTNQVRFGTGNDLLMYHQSNSSYIINNTGNLNIGSNNEVRIKGGFDVAEHMGRFIDNGAVELYYDGSKKFETTSYGGLVTGQLLASSGFKVNDGVHITLGTDNDFRFYHDGSNAAWNNTTGSNYLYGGGGNFFIKPVNAESSIDAVANGAVNLYYDNSKKLETTSTGVTISNGGLNVQRSTAARAGAIYWAGFGDTNHVLWQDYYDNPNGTRTSGNFDGMKWNCYGGLQLFRGNEAETIAKFLGNGANELWYDNSKKFETRSGGAAVFGHFELGDDNKVMLGNGNDLQIYHDGNNSLIENAGTGSLNLYGDDVNILNKAKNEFKAKFITDGAVELYHNNTKKFETSSEGAKHTLSNNGTIRFDQTSSANNKFQSLQYSRSGNNRGDVSQIQIGEGNVSEGRINIKTSAGNSGMSGGVFISNGGTSFGSMSDIRLKTKVADISDALTDIAKIDTWKYTWKSDKSNTVHLGITAQSVNEVYPEVVEQTNSLNDDETDTTEYLAVLHQELIPVCIAAIKELKAKVEMLETKVATLEGG